ncbi:hypothetical protein FB451DRAFT_1167253 [Mycena latifolia]|nr:hypothetical protein FB451DRAFT_1167253 [Mycena latifolia]
MPALLSLVPQTCHLAGIFHRKPTRLKCRQLEANSAKANILMALPLIQFDMWQVQGKFRAINCGLSGTGGEATERGLLSNLITLMGCRAAENNPYIQRDWRVREIGPQEIGPHTAIIRSGSDRHTAEEETKNLQLEHDPSTAVFMAPNDQFRAYLDDAEANDNAMPPSFAFPSYIENTGTALVDKTHFIAVLDDLLNQYAGCLIALPPGTGQTTLKTMIATWYDTASRTNVSAFKKVFRRLRIDPIRRERQAKRNTLSAAECHCLLFDLADIGPETSADGISSSINLCETMRHFMVKYEQELGIIVFEEGGDPVAMIQEIVQRTSERWAGCVLFIAVDHWDSPILKSAASSNDSAATEGIARQLTDFLCALAALNTNQSVAKLLILGNLPLSFDGPQKHGDIRAIEDMSSHPNMDGAFGMTWPVFPPFSLIISFGAGIRVYSPPWIPSLVKRPDIIYNFDLVLHHAASALKLNNGHRRLPNAPLLQHILQLCRNLLEDSSLRRWRKMVLHPLHITKVAPGTVSLVKFVNDEEASWRLLLYLGALKVTAETKPNDQNPMWTLEIASTFAYNQDGKQPGNSILVGAGRGRNGFLDIFICKIVRLHRRHVVAIELKCIPVERIFRALRRDPKWTKLIEDERLKACRKLIQELAHKSLDELRAQEYIYYSSTNKKDSQGKVIWVANKVTVGATLDDAEKQLRSYMHQGKTTLLGSTR